METVVCALCGSDKNEILETRTKNKEIKANTVICRNCGFVFLNPRMTKREYAEFYSFAQYRKLAGGTEQPTEALDQRSLRGAEEKFTFFSRDINLSQFRTKKFLDIGCSAGYLPFVFSQNGWEAEGLEPTRSFVQHGRKKFGLNIMTGLIEAHKLTKRYSLITLIHVFEHITNPHVVLQKLRKALAEDGLLYIEVPNVQEFYGRFEQSCDIAHPYFYSPETLSAVLRINGFDIVKLVAGSSVRVFAKKGAPAKVKVDEYEKTLEALRNNRRSYYLKGYFIFTPLFDSFSRFVANHEMLAIAFKKLARAYSRSGLPFSRAVKELGAVEL
ncbi:MAG: class I SAM-dependent methyltransferase [Candidatus Aenigmarchaeota archaeon]|nr:class I SAM-dependent methyltransferase [Candidatus Aenigmarchaeota archaeon]